MAIAVRLFATLRAGRGKVVPMDWHPELTVRQIIAQLAIPEADVAILLINGRDGAMDTHLVESDVVSIFPPVGGG